MTQQFHVRASWDSEARVWFAYSDDVPGLATEADNLDALEAKLQVMVPELLEANGLFPAGTSLDFPHKSPIPATAPGRWSKLVLTKTCATLLTVGLCRPLAGLDEVNRKYQHPPCV
jgi:predicted RNase H-like HicB family nuclease